MSLDQEIKKAKAQLREAGQQWLACKDPKRKRGLYRDIQNARIMIERAEYWLASTNTGGENVLENKDQPNQSGLPLQV